MSNYLARVRAAVAKTDTYLATGKTISTSGYILLNFARAYSGKLEPVACPHCGGSIELNLEPVEAQPEATAATIPAEPVEPATEATAQPVAAVEDASEPVEDAEVT